MIRVVLADDHPVVRTGLRALVDAQEGMTVVADFGAAEDVLTWLDGGGEADVLLLDLRFGEGRMTGAQASAGVCARQGPPVLILTTYDTDADVITAVEAGARGYLLKDAPTDELAAAVRAAAAGEVILGPSVQRRLVRRLSSPVTLSSRELEVLQLVAEGAGNDQIAARLFVSRATVKTHLAHVYQKLGVSSRTAAVAAARSSGLLT